MRRNSTSNIAFPAVRKRGIAKEKSVLPLWGGTFFYRREIADALQQMKGEGDLIREKRGHREKKKEGVARIVTLRLCERPE